MMMMMMMMGMYVCMYVCSHWGGWLFVEKKIDEIFFIGKIKYLWYFMKKIIVNLCHLRCLLLIEGT